jgi:hypothetical protein
MGKRFTMITVFEGLDTGDGRYITPGALAPRELPLTLMAMFVNPELGGHGLAVVAGRIDSMVRVDATRWVDGATGQTWGTIADGPVWAWTADGEFADTDDGAQAEQLVTDQHLRGVSVDLAETTVEWECLEEDEDGWCVDEQMTVLEGFMAAATVCNTPAFRGCNIVLADDQAPADDPAPAEAVAAAAWLPAFRLITAHPTADCVPCTTAAPAAVTAAGGPTFPPQAWFTDPTLTGPTALTITDPGRLYGHLALWGTCHTGYPGRCVTPPKSGTGYSLFRVGSLRTAEGADVPVGHVTLGGGHADLRADTAAARAHYDDTGTAVADVAAGEDEHGIWVAGALRPDLTDAQVRELRASPLSGDWRGHGAGLELVAALAVNTPGFPVPRQLAAAGVPTAMVAAGGHAVTIATTAVERPSPATLLGLQLRRNAARSRLAGTRK